MLPSPVCSVPCPSLRPVGPYSPASAVAFGRTKAVRAQEGSEGEALGNYRRYSAGSSTEVGSSRCAWKERARTPGSMRTHASTVSCQSPSPVYCSSPPSPGPHLQVQPPASPVGASSSSLWPAQSAPPTVYTTCYTSNVPALSVLAPPLAPPTRPGASFSMLSPDGRSKSPPLQMVRSHSTPATPGAGLGRLNRRGLSSFASVPAGLFDST